ncbi:hypothetical protein [Polaromonas sp. CG9_12]|nr:hypothetical protein [Polaromonas sp. CG9_12]
MLHRIGLPGLSGTRQALRKLGTDCEPGHAAQRTLSLLILGKENSFCPRFTI